MPRRKGASNRSWIMPTAGALICIVSCPIVWGFPQWKLIAWIIWAAGAVLVSMGCFRGTPDRLPGSLLTKWAFTAVISSGGYLALFPTLK
ncbi:MAG: hypothetical protein EOP83_17115 [Verrucomicrobiaceae bacterium]|nr:MAG: hypothetical protein EOP83_17115 [Verrucomicrobiaceae bacterium]